MGFWNVRPPELRTGDELRITSMGGEEFLLVRDVESADGEQTRVRLEWLSHVPIGPFWETMENSRQLTVRR